MTLFDNHRVLTASLVKAAISNTATANVYFTFGKPKPWPGEANGVPIVANTVTSGQTLFDIWNEMIGAKKITGNDVSHVIPRYDWAANTTYVQYDESSSNLGTDNVKFYVVNNAYNVYKCLFNNNGRASSVEPSATNPSNVTQTSDGYVWKYMYSIASSDQIRFTTGSYIPVKRLTSDDGSLQWDVQAAAVDGAIYAINLGSGGTGYSNVSNLAITIAGDGSGAVATANINALSTSVHTITLSNYGTGYTNASVSITGGGGSGANATVSIGPPGGHGSNPIYELQGKNLMLNPRLINNEGGILTVANQFRQVAILLDPKVYGTLAPAGNTAYSQLMSITVSGPGADYIQDETVYQGVSLTTATFTGTVVEWDTSNTVIRLAGTTGTPISDPLIGFTSAAAKYVTSIEYPDLKNYSGLPMYADNIEAIARSINQSEDFKILVKF